MPNNDFISNILEIKDLIITNAESTSEEIHIYFKRELPVARSFKQY